MEQQTPLGQLSALRDEFNAFAQDARQFEAAFVASRVAVRPFKRKAFDARIDEIKCMAEKFEEHAGEAELIVEKLTELPTLPEGEKKDILTSDILFSLIRLEHALIVQAKTGPLEEAAFYGGFARRVRDVKNGF